MMGSNRLRLASLCLIASLLAAPATMKAQATPWPSITPGEWELTAQNDTMQVFVKPAPGGANRRAWMRMEYREPDLSNGIVTRSAVFLQEHDCAGRRTRDLEFRSYTQNNMQDLRLADVTADDWGSSPAGTIRGHVLEAVCQGSPASTAPAAPSNSAPAPPWPKLTEGAWTPMGERQNVKLFASLWAPTTWVRGWIRYEFNQPQQAPDGAYQSSRVLSEYDCKAMRNRAVIEVRYAGPNLEGAVGMSTPVGRWEKVDPRASEGQAAAIFCNVEAEAAAALAAEQRERGDPVMSLQQLATLLDRPYGHVRVGDWHAIPPSETGKLFVRGTKAGDYPMVELRWEYAEPRSVAGETARSSWHVVEMNCPTFQYRFASTTVYPQSNLKGSGVKVARSTAWLPMTGDYETLHMICDRELEARADGVLAWLATAGRQG